MFYKYICTRFSGKLDDLFSALAGPKQWYLPHRSHLGLEMATRACLGAAGVSGRAVCACFGAARTLKMYVRDPPKQCYLLFRSHLALDMAPPACVGAAGGLPGRSQCRSVTHQNSAIYRSGATWPSKWCLGPASVLLECPAGPFGSVSVLPGYSKWLLGAASVLEKAFPPA